MRSLTTLAMGEWMCLYRYHDGLRDADRVWCAVGGCYYDLVRLGG